MTDDLTPAQERYRYLRTDLFVPISEHCVVGQSSALADKLTAMVKPELETVYTALLAVQADLAEAQQRLATATATIDRIDRLVPILPTPAPMRPSGTSLVAAAPLREILGTGHLEAYCVDSGHAIRFGAGDRCRTHGASEQPCTGALRRPRCTHEYGSRNGSGRCDECGRPIEQPTEASDD